MESYQMVSSHNKNVIIVAGLLMMQNALLEGPFAFKLNGQYSIMVGLGLKVFYH